jgi:hypothetical protein
MGPVSTQLKSISHAAAARATSSGAKPRVYYEIGYTDATGEIYAPADKSFLAEMVTLAGADPITTGDPNTYEIPLEKLIERDPQVIIIGVNPFYSPAPASLAKRPGWKVMTAIKDGQVRTVKDTEITRPGPRLAIGLRALASDLARHPAPAGVVGDRRTVSARALPHEIDGRHRRPPPWAPGPRHARGRPCPRRHPRRWGRSRVGPDRTGRQHRRDPVAGVRHRPRPDVDAGHGGHRGTCGCRGS